MSVNKKGMYMPIKIFLLIIVGIFFWCGKGGFLIAGYNVASKKEKERYNKKRLTRCIAVAIWNFAILQIVKGVINKIWFSDYVVPVLMLLIIIALCIAGNTYCKKD